ATAFARTPRQKNDVLEHLRSLLGDVLGGPYSWLIWRFVSAHADLVSAPPGGHWAYGGTDHPYVAARHWITGRTRRPTEAEALGHLVRRYIAGFGPATIADIAQFTGQVPARIRPALAALTPAVRRFRDLDGRTYFDLPRAPRPAPDRA